jgi:primosomal protein N' (replication factor Y) (superfamily II helicase)
VSGVERIFDYAIPDAMRGDLRVGSRVRVLLQRRRVAGWVVATGDPDPSFPLERLNPVIQIIGQGPAPEVVDLTQWAAHHWCGPRRSVLVAASPPRVVKHRPSSKRFAPSASWRALAHRPAVGLLEGGGGLMRWPPTWDLLPLVAAAHTLGPVLVVAPSVQQAAVLARRAERHGVSVALLPDAWAAAAGGVDLVIGARHAVWAPCADLAAIVVIDEHDEAHYEERSPTWHAPTVARERARRSGLPVLTASPCPTVVAHHHLGPPVTPARNDERDAWPIMDIIDVGDRPPWDRSPLTTPVRTWLADHERRVVCVTNTTGQARLLACRGCAGIVRCATCDAAVAQRDDFTLICRRCGAQRPPVCAACGASALTVLRPGLARVRREVHAAARRPVAEVTASSHADTDDPWAGAGVVVGTEAVLHRVRRADVVVFCDLDAELLAPRYRAEEQVLALLARAARLVGPRSGGGRIVVQTALPDHPVLRAVQSVDLDRLVAPELERRRALGWPPLGALATVEGLGADTWMHDLRLIAAEGVSVMGPTDGRFLVRSTDPERLADALSSLARPPRSRCRVVVDPPRL